MRGFILTLAIFSIRLLEILFHAVGYFVATSVFNLSFLWARCTAGAPGHFYAAAIIYTSLGAGDVQPNDCLNFMIGLGAHNGLTLVAWFASSTFATMD